MASNGSSYAIDMLEETDETDRAKQTPQRAASGAVVRSSLDRVGRLSPSRTKAVGDGEDLRFHEGSGRP
jgi:hypothetical protein